MSKVDVDALSNEIRRIDGGHKMGAGALAESLAPWVESHAAARVAEALEAAAKIAEGSPMGIDGIKARQGPRAAGTWNEDSPVGRVTRAIASAIRASIHDPA